MSSSELMSARVLSLKGPAAMLQHDDKFSNNNSFRKPSDEIRKAVRDSLNRQNLLSSPTKDDKSSLSQSIRFSARNRIDTEPFDGEEGKEETVKMKNPSLIVRLMGLDKVPSEDVQPGKIEEKSKKNSKWPKLMSQIGLAKSMNLQSNKPTPKQRRATLRNFIEREKLEDHMNNDQDSEYEALSASHSESSPSSENSSPSSSYGGQSCSASDEVQEILPLKKILKQDEMEFVKLMNEEVTFNDEQDLPRKIGRHRVRGLPTKTDLAQKANVKLPPEQMKKTTLTFQKHQSKDENNKPMKKADEGRRQVLGRLNSADKKELKAVPARLSPTRTSKPTRKVPVAVTEKQLVSAKSSSFAIAGRSQKHNITPQIRPPLKNFGVVIDNSTAVQQAKRSARPKDGGELSRPAKINYIARNIAAISSGSYKQAKLLNSFYKDSIKKDKKLVNEVMPKPEKAKSSKNRRERIAKLCAKQITITTTRREIEENDLRELLSSPPVLIQANELCQNSLQPLYDEKELNADTKDAKLYLAFTQEFIERRSYHLKLSSHPMLQISPWNASAFETSDQLVQRVSEGIGTIMSYSNENLDDDNNDDNDDDDDYDNGEILLIAGIYRRLHRDFRLPDDLNALWNLGWKNGISIEETDNVVTEIAEDTLSMLIQEFAIELLDC